MNTKNDKSPRGEVSPVPPPPFGAPSLEQLTGLVFELASQLHIERAHRIALEEALAETNIVSATDIETAAKRARGRMQEALDRAMAGVLRVLTEDTDQRRPLRAQSNRKN